MTFLRMSLIGGGMILIVAFLRLLLQRRVHRSVFLALWVIAALRLLIPVFIPTGVEIALPSETSQGLAATAVRTFVHPSGRQPVQLTTASNGAPLFWLWVSVAALLLIGFAVSHLRSRRAFRFSVPMPEEAELAPNVRLLDGLASPLTYGVFRPIILLPADFDWQDRQKLTQVLLHERTHIRYRDVLVKGLLLIACCLHWFNPTVWLMLFLASQDMEMRCDAAVVRALGRGGKLSYARTLVATERERTFGGVLQTGFSVNSTARRLKALAKANVQPAISVLLTLVTVVMASACFLTVNAAGEKAALPNIVPTRVFASDTERDEQPAPQSKQQEKTELPVKLATEPTAPTEATEPTESAQPIGAVLQFSGLPSVVTSGQMLTVTLSGSTSARLVSDQPTVLAVLDSYYASEGGVTVFTLAAYRSGAANIYFDNGSESSLLATVTVQSSPAEEVEPWFMGEDYQPQVDINPSNGPAGDLSWLFDGEETP